MDHANNSYAVLDEHKIGLHFVEDYRKTYKENLNSLEFTINKLMQTHKESEKEYTRRSEPAEDHPFNKDLQTFEEVYKLMQKTEHDPNLRIDDVIKLIERLTLAVERKDQLARQTRKEFEAINTNHSRTRDENVRIIKTAQDRIDQLSNTEFTDIDKVKLDHIRTTLSNYLENISAARAYNLKQIDECLIETLKYLRFEKTQPLSEFSNKFILEVKKTEDKFGAGGKREMITKMTYDFFRDQLKTQSAFRNSMRRTHLMDELALIDTQALNQPPQAGDPISDPFSGKLASIESKVAELFEFIIQQLITVKTTLNTLMIKIKGISDNALVKSSSVMQELKAIFESVTKIEATFYNIQIMDICLFYSLTASSYSDLNRRLYATIETCAQTYVESQVTHLYLELMEKGNSEVPTQIEQFVLRFVKLMKERHILNVERYLVPDFDTEDTISTEEEETWKSVVFANYKAIIKTIDLAVNTINEFLDEASKGRNKNGIHYSIWYRNYPNLMLSLSPSLTQLESFKIFAQANFDPKLWRADKTRIRNLLKIRIDILRIINDKALSNERKINTLRDHVNILKSELAVFADRIRSVENSKSHYSGLVKCYIRTMTGFWSKMLEIVDKAEENMLGLIKNQPQVDLNKPKPLTEKQRNWLRGGYDGRLKMFGGFLDMITALRIEDVLNHQHLRVAIDNSRVEMNRLATDQETVNLLSGNIQEFQKEQHFYKNIYCNFPVFIEGLTLICDAYSTLDVTDFTDKFENKNDKISYQMLRKKYADNFKAQRERLNSNEMMAAINKARVLKFEAGNMLEELVRTFKEYSEFMEETMNHIVDAYKQDTDDEGNLCIDRIQDAARGKSGLYEQVMKILVPKIRADCIKERKEQKDKKR